MLTRSVLQRFLLGGLFGLMLLLTGCGGSNDPVKSPGVGEDAPVMDETPGTKP